MPLWALMPCSKGCLICRISVTRSATPLVIPATTNPLLALVIDAPHHGPMAKVIDHAKSGRIDGETEQVLIGHAQRAGLRHSDHAGMRHHQHTLVLIRGRDGVQFPANSPLELREAFSAGHAPIRELLRPEARPSRELLENLLPREPLPSAEMDLAQPRPDFEADSQPARGKGGRRTGPAKIAGINDCDLVWPEFSRQSGQLPAAFRRQLSVDLSLEPPISLGGGM